MCSSDLDLDRARVGFNYLGQFDNMVRVDSLFRSAPESPGPGRSSDSARNHLVDINCDISDGQLRVNWTYSRNIHRPETIENLGKRFLSSVTELMQPVHVSDFTQAEPTEFPMARLDARELRSVLGLAKKHTIEPAT